MQNMNYMLTVLIFTSIFQHCISQTTLEPFSKAKLVDIQQLSPKIKLDLRYKTKENFLGKAVYPPTASCLLRPEVAKQLAAVQKSLEAQKLGLKVFDCYRPLSVQHKMWKIMPDDRYVANPKVGSRHNRGAAVDLTLIDLSGKELEMPTKFDDFSKKAHANYAGASKTAIRNRKLLKSVMEKQGFSGIATEWWHFDGRNSKQYELLDINF
jgi:zinc D-Ala-D-Ala dipeptidase